MYILTVCIFFCYRPVETIPENAEEVSLIEILPGNE